MAGFMEFSKAGVGGKGMVGRAEMFRGQKDFQKKLRADATKSAIMQK